MKRNYFYLFFLVSKLRKRYASDMQTRTHASEQELRIVHQAKLLPNPKYIVVNDTRMSFDNFNNYYFELFIIKIGFINSNKWH